MTENTTPDVQLDADLTDETTVLTLVEQPQSIRSLRHAVQHVAENLNDDLHEEVVQALTGRGGMSFEEQKASANMAREAFTKYADSIGASAESEGSLGASLKTAFTSLDTILAVINAREAEANKPAEPESPTVVLHRYLALAQAGLDKAQAAKAALAEAEASAEEALSAWETIRADVMVQMENATVV